jgi:hypothetical protein
MSPLFPVPIVSALSPLFLPLFLRMSPLFLRMSPLFLRLRNRATNSIVRQEAVSKRVSNQSAKVEQG